MNINASAWSASKDFIPNVSFNTQATTFTPQSYALPYGHFNQNAQSFNPSGSFQSQQPLPPQGASQPAPNTQMNAGGMNNLYPNQGQW